MLSPLLVQGGVIARSFTGQGPDFQRAVSKPRPNNHLFVRSLPIRRSVRCYRHEDFHRKCCSFLHHQMQQLPYRKKGSGKLFILALFHIGIFFRLLVFPHKFNCIVQE